MAIEVGRDGRLFTLHTADTSYQMLADEKGTLLHLYYGERLREGDDLAELIYCTDMGFSGNPSDAGEDRTYSLDQLPQEISGFGTGDFRDSMVQLVHGDGSRAAEFRFAGYRIQKGSYAIPGMPALYDTEEEPGETLVITLKERFTDIEADLLYGVFEKGNILTRAAVLRNGGKTDVTVERFLSMNLDIPFGDFDMVYFAGRHAYERGAERVTVRRAKVEIGSVRGTSSHQYNPAFLLCEPAATEEQGRCFGFCLVYSGNFLGLAQRDQKGQTRVQLGINPEGFSWRLAPGESFYAPQVILSASTHGFGELSRRYHSILREHLCRGRWKHERRPALINNWEATYLDFNEEKLVRLASQAAELGIELLVLDDGWFGKREQDNSGLGDWFVNEKKLGGTLRSLGERVNAMGMKFGLWFEPEMISEDSDLYRAHPDWAMTIPGREPNRGRAQLVLDMSRQDVRDYLLERLTAILTDAPIAYVKWDMNRSLADVFSRAGVCPTGELYHRYVLGLYDLLERFCRRFPEVLLEGCSGGGGRFDAAMLYYSPQIWCSDNTDAINRLSIQYGTSFFYPVSAMGAHVSASPNHQTGRVTPFATRGAVALAGSFGYELDPNQLSVQEKEQIREQLALFRAYYGLTHEGDYYRLTAPGEKDFMAWCFAEGDASRVLLTLVKTDSQGNPLPVHVCPRGMEKGARYRLTATGEMRSGAAWMQGGYTHHGWLKEYESLLLLWERV